MACKTRVALLKRQSIPRLELLGAVLLARLCDKITKKVRVLITTYWVDSMTTLCWIRNDKHWKQYVQHRVNEVRKQSSSSAWRYGPGPQNLADLPSRKIWLKVMFGGTVPNFRSNHKTNGNRKIHPPEMVTMLTKRQLNPRLM